MEKVKFPWHQLQAPTDNSIENEMTSDFRTLLKGRMKAALPYTLLIGVVFILLTVKDAPSKTSTKITPSQDIEALALVLPVRKKQIIRPETLRPVLVNKKELSKKQIFERLKIEDVEKLSGQLRAKKDIPLGKPLFWSDVEIMDLTDGTKADNKLLIINPRQQDELK